MQCLKPLIFDPKPLQYQRYEDVVSYLNDKIKLNRSSSFHRASCFGLDNFFKSFHLKPNVSAIIQDLYWIISFVLENCPISKAGQVERDSDGNIFLPKQSDPPPIADVAEKKRGEK